MVWSNETIRFTKLLVVNSINYNNMKSFLNISLSVVLVGSFVTSSYNATAGNPERAGQAGAAQLLRGRPAAARY